MALDLQDLPIIVLITFSFAGAIALTAILVTIIGRMLKKQTEPQEIEMQNLETKTTITRKSSSRMNQLYQYSVYILVFEILAILLIFPFYGLTENVIFADLWPVILVVVVLIFTSLAIIDWSKLRTKRTVQKDMRRY